MGVVGSMWLTALGLAGVVSFRSRQSTGGWAYVLCLVQLCMGGNAVVSGSWRAFSALFLSAAWIRQAPLYWCTSVADGVVELALGLALLAGMLLTLTYGGKEDHGGPHGRRVVAVVQAALGALAMALGAWTVVYMVLIAPV
jgi:hypothetical protein